jgi:hypothetical protein
MKPGWKNLRGVVYFLQVAPAGPIKIGFTSGPVHNRIRALQQSSPHELKWLGFFAGTPKDEQAAHKLLAASQCRCEWFHPTFEVLSFVSEKCASFNEQNYLSDILSKDCLERIELAHKPWSRNRDGLNEILNVGGMTPWDFHAWREGWHPPPRDVALRMAEYADKILLSRAQTSEKVSAP